MLIFKFFSGPRQPVGRGEVVAAIQSGAGSPKKARQEPRNWLRIREISSNKAHLSISEEGIRSPNTVTLLGVPKSFIIWTVTLDSQQPA